MPLIDILFLVTVALLVLHGFRNGAVASLLSLLSIPAALLLSWAFGPQFAKLLATNGFNASPLVSYIILFFVAVLALHIVSSLLKRVVTNIPVIGTGDRLLGGALGFVEAWVLWLVLLLVLNSFLQNAQATADTVNHVIPTLNITVAQFQGIHEFYNSAVGNSIFAHVNDFFTHSIHGLPTLAAPSK